MELQSNELKLIYKDDLVTYLTPLNMQKITYNGVEGMFISFEKYKLLENYLIDYFVMQKNYIEMNKRMNDYWKLEHRLGIWKSSFAGSLAVNVSLSVIIVGACFLVYALK